MDNVILFIEAFEIIILKFKTFFRTCLLLNRLYIFKISFIQIKQGSIYKNMSLFIKCYYSNQIFAGIVCTNFILYWIDKKNIIINH